MSETKQPDTDTGVTCPSCGVDITIANAGGHGAYCEGCCVSGDGYTLIRGDCLEVLPMVAAGSVDAVIADIPYGTTQCRWDNVIPFPPMWKVIKHVRKERAAVVLFGSEPFSSLLRVSNLGEYKYDWVWKKDKSTGHLDAWKRPMKNNENIMVFCDGQATYNPQIARKPEKDIRPNPNRKYSPAGDGVYGAFGKSSRTISLDEKMPQSIIKFNTTNHGERGFHPTQKPVALMEYLIKTYTNKGDTVLDFTMGSGSTGVAAVKLGRKFIGIEQDADYFAIAQERIANAAGDYVTTDKEKSTGQVALWDMLP